MFELEEAQQRAVCFGTLGRSRQYVSLAESVVGGVDTVDANGDTVFNAEDVGDGGVSV